MSTYEVAAPPIPYGWVQHKGSDICIDIHCECGVLGHIDGDFVYTVKCKACGRIYGVSGYVSLIPLTQGRIVGWHQPYEFDEGPYPCVKHVVTSAEAQRDEALARAKRAEAALLDERTERGRLERKLERVRNGSTTAANHSACENEIERLEVRIQEDERLRPRERDQVVTAVSRAELAEAALRCPVCDGTGKGDGAYPCACGGSGSIRDAYDWVVRELDAVHADYDRLIAAGWNTEGRPERDRGGVGRGNALLLVEHVTRGDRHVEPGYTDFCEEWFLWDGSIPESTGYKVVAWKRWPEVPRVAAIRKMRKIPEEGA